MKILVTNDDGIDSPGIRALADAMSRQLSAVSRQPSVPTSRVARNDGFALNVDPDLSYFDHIVPCGMPDARVTSMSAELGRPVSVDQVVPALTSQFGRVFGMEMVQERVCVGKPVAVDTPSAG